MNKINTNRKERVWEIDAIRGALIFFVVVHHFYFVLSEACINTPFSNFDPHAFVARIDPLGFLFRIDGEGYIQHSYYKVIYDHTYSLGVDVFFIISGISCIFSRDNLKSGLRLLGGAAFISAFTMLLSVLTEDETQFIRFGALHCYAVCHLIWYFFLEEKSNKVVLFVAGVSLMIGYYLRSNPVYLDTFLLVPFGFHENGVTMRDYWPVFPMLGWFLIGVVMGKVLYSERVTRFPKQANRKWYRPLCFLGRYSGLIYCGHIVVYALAFIVIGHIFNLY